MRRQVRLLSAALLALALAGCKEERRAAPAAEGAGVAGGPPFRVDVVPPSGPCAVGAPCEVGVRLTALGRYHVNDKYPFAFVPTDTAGVAHQGASKFAIDDPQTGGLTVRVQADAPGTRRVAGAFKLSVCTADECAIEAVPVDLEVAFQ